MSFQKLTPDELRLHKGISFTGITTVFLCHDGRGNIFFTKRSKNTRDEHGRWDAGGGGLKHGQSVEDSLRREVKEEYNVEPTKVQFLGYFDAFRRNEDNLDTHWLAMCFAVLIDPEKVQINEPDMVDDYGWFPLENLPKPMHSQFTIFMDKLGPALKQALNNE